MNIPKEYWEETIDCNVALAKRVLEKSDSINKGRYTHDINSTAHILRGLIKECGKVKDPSNKTFLSMVRNKNSLAMYLFQAEHNL